MPTIQELYEPTFQELFKKYRLRSEFETLGALGDALYQKGIFYDESIYSRWQQGSRRPTQRFIMLALLEIFIQRQAIKSLEQANEFLASSGMGYLTKKEVETLPSIK